MFLGDYHTHTTYSDGKGSVAENALAAKRRGLKEIAVTDHGFHVLPRGGKKFLDTKAECREAERLTGIRVLAGVEADVVSPDGTIDLPEALLPEVECLVVGFHKFAPPKGLSAFFKMYFVTYFNGLLPTGKKARARNTHALIAAMDRYPVKILAHLGHSLRVNVAEVAKACAERGVLIELNAKHLRALKGHGRALAESGARFVLCSDAHKPEDVGDLDAAFDFAVKSGIDPARIVNYTE